MSLRRFGAILGLSATLLAGLSTFAAADAHADDAPPAAGTPLLSDDALVAIINQAIAEQEYRRAIETVNELHARKSRQFNPVSHAWLRARYGDLRRATSLLVPILAKKNEFSQYLHFTMEPLLRGTLAFHAGNRESAIDVLHKGIDQYAAAAEQDPLLFLILMQKFDLLAQLYRERGEHRAAAQCIRDMRPLLKKRAYGPELLVLPDLNQAELHLAKGNTALAAESLKSAERYLEAEYKMPKATRARVLVNMGVVATRRGQWPEAKRLLEEALALEESIFVDFHWATIETLRHLTNLHVAMGKPREALAYATRAADRADKRARHLLSLGSERQKRIAARHVEHDADTVVSLHLQHAPTDVQAARLALTTILRRKGMVFEAMVGGISALHDSLDKDGQALAKEFADLSAQLSTMISRGPVDVTLEDYQSDLFELEEQRRSLEERLVAHTNRSMKYEFDDAPLVQLAEVQASIPEGAALVELFEYRPHRPFGPPIHSTWGRPRFAAYILHKTGDPAWLDLGQSGAIEKTATALVQELAATGSHRELARKLDELVMQPVRRALGTTRWMLLSPDGALNFVPFYALVDEQNRELVDTSSITYLMTGRDLLRLRETKVSARQDPVIVANPDFGKTIETETNERSEAQSRSVDLSRIRFSQLAGTEEEGQQVSKTLAKAHLLNGLNATEEALKELHGPRVLHIATHGFFLPDIENVTGTTSKTETDPWNANPLLRSGLALVGANRRKSQSDREDGVLTALEVSNLDLRGTRLVVLSACETGVGQALRGEGVYGLQRAMMIAGAETEVTSLWQVSDNATKSLMVKFYEELAKGAGRGEAMRLAQLAVRETYPHPYYWASFIVTGSNATLEGQNMAPDPKNFQVLPSARGCGCRVGETNSSENGWVVLILMGLMVGRRRMGFSGRT
ncbi:MAG TPA: CHAT domain-containing protein [Polyangium sp.]|nr:CHAT domain-containing protein [Polyangium sp.]